MLRRTFILICGCGGNIRKTEVRLERNSFFYLALALSILRWIIYFMDNPFCV